jgi:DNA-binding NtrC family response regulator
MLDESSVTDKVSILVVDDNDMILESLVNILENEGFITSIARTGKEAIEKTEKEFFNAILIDVNLPDMTGFDLISRINETTSIIKKLIITGFPDTHIFKDDVYKKADAFLVKPFDPEILLDLIDKNIKQQELELKYTKEKILEHIKTRIKNLEAKKPTQASIDC